MQGVGPETRRQTLTLHPSPLGAQGNQSGGTECSGEGQAPELGPCCSRPKPLIYVGEVRWYEYPRPLVALAALKGVAFGLVLIGVGAAYLVMGTSPARFIGIVFVALGLWFEIATARGFAKRFAKPSSE